MVLAVTPVVCLSALRYPAVNNKHRAVVRYIGLTNFAEGVWYGLELERDIGATSLTMLSLSGD
jgi:hypothetical protein